jgi:hypothetical protein
MLSHYLESKNFDDYFELLGKDLELEESKEFQTVQNSFKTTIKGAKWDRLSVGVFKTFLKGDSYKHYALKIFLMNEKNSVISPILMNKAFEEIQM